MADQQVVIPFHTVTTRFRGVVSLLLTFAAMWVWIAVSRSASVQIRIVISAVFALGALGVQLDQIVVIDRATREVQRQITLWGIRLRFATWSLQDFCGVGTYRHSSASGGGVRNETVHVGLRRHNKSLLDLRYFNVPHVGAPCPVADAFASEIGELTGFGYEGVA